MTQSKKQDWAGLNFLSATPSTPPPRHPYTRALLASTPRIDVRAQQTRQVLTGELPSPLNPPSGCAFHKRCPFAVARCAVEVPRLETLGGGQLVACHRVHEIG